MSEEDQKFEEWFEGYRTTAWRAIRPDMGPAPSPGYMVGLKTWMHLGWIARGALPTGSPRE